MLRVVACLLLLRGLSLRAGIQPGESAKNQEDSQSRASSNVLDAMLRHQEFRDTPACHGEVHIFYFPIENPTSELS